MATAEEILNSPDYQNADLGTKRAIFVRHVARTPDFANANAETQRAILRRFGLLEEAEPTQAEQIASEREMEAPEGAPARDTSARDELAITAGGIGAAKGIAETILPKPEGVPASQVSRAMERLSAAQVKLTEAQRAVAEGPVGRMSTIGDLMNDFNAAKAEVDAAKQELQALQGAGRAAPAAQAVAEAPAGQAARTGSGAQNWAKAMATQELPEATLEQVQTMRKTGEGGAQRLIDQDLERLKKIQSMGAGDFQLIGEGRGQLMLPPQEAARQQAEMQARQAQQAQEQARARQAAEQQRAAQEADFQRRQQAARQRVQQAGQRASTLGQQTKQATALERQLTNAQMQERIAREAAERAKAGELGPLARTGTRIGSSKILGPVLGGLGAAATVMSVDEAIARYKAGDYSGAVLPTLEAAFGIMSMSPPVTPITAAIKGLGTIGGLTIAGFEMGREGYDYMKKLLADREEKRQQADMQR